ncbi:MAG: signal peptidase I [Acidobacteriota bacterium]
MNEQPGTTLAAESPAPSKNLLREYCAALGWALVLALVIRTAVVQTFEIPSGSMLETLQIGDYLAANKFIYGVRIPFTGYRLPGLRAPQPGDVIIFEFPQDTSQDYIKRVVGQPGDVVEVRDKRVYVNGALREFPGENHRDKNVMPTYMGPRDNFGPVKVPADSYFVMGDNRDESYDSRFWGFVPMANVKGKAMIKYFSKEPGTGSIRWGNIGQVIE